MEYKIEVNRLVISILLSLAIGFLQISYAQGQQGEPTLKQVIEVPAAETVAQQDEKKATATENAVGASWRTCRIGLFLIHIFSI